MRKKLGVKIKNIRYVLKPPSFSPHPMTKEVNLIFRIDHVWFTVFTKKLKKIRKLINSEQKHFLHQDLNLKVWGRIINLFQFVSLSSSFVSFVHK